MQICLRLHRVENLSDIPKHKKDLEISHVSSYISSAGIFTVYPLTHFSPKCWYTSEFLLNNGERRKKIVNTLWRYVYSKILVSYSAAWWEFWWSIWLQYCCLLLTFKMIFLSLKECFIPLTLYTKFVLRKGTYCPAHWKLFVLVKIIHVGKRINGKKKPKQKPNKHKLHHDSPGFFSLLIRWARFGMNVAENLYTFYTC